MLITVRSPNLGVDIKISKSIISSTIFCVIVTLQIKINLSNSLLSSLKFPNIMIELKGA
jgi:hypothetical protein